MRMSKTHQELKGIASGLSLLYAEDDQTTREQYETIFRLLFREVVAVEDGQVALELFQNRKFDLLITDLTMPRIDGITLIGEILTLNPSQHILVMTAHNTSENLRDSIEFQVDGILIKPVMMDKLFQLLYKVCMPIHLEQIEEQKNLLNRGDEKIIHLLENGDHAICLAVIDNFDTIVKQFGTRTKVPIFNAAREHLSHFGMEDENSLQLYDDTLAFSVEKSYMERMLHSLQSFSENNSVLTVPVDDAILYITLSYGVISIKPDRSIINKKKAFLEHISSIAESIRNDSKSTFVVKMDVDLEDAQQRSALSWLGTTLEAVKQETIVPVFQPIAAIDTMEVSAYEVFARIKQGEEYILPKFFIDLSEKAGILEDISEIVFKKSFEKFSKTTFPFHINITDSEWKDNALEEYLAYLNVHYKIDYSRVVLGITSYDSFQPDGKIVKRLLRLKKMGYKIALKEFGKGNINIEILSILQPDYLKIDQILIQKSLSDPHLKAIVSSLFNYVIDTDIKTVLSGVESEEILNAGKALGIGYAQGYYIKRPSEEL